MAPKSTPRSHPQNAEGPFYVQHQECISCGAPEMCAPKLISHDEQDHCFFARQPSTPKETDAAIRGLWASCCGAIRYRGNDEVILSRLAEMGLAQQCDIRLTNEPRRVDRAQVIFEFRDNVSSRTPNETVKAITTRLNESLGKGTSSDFCFSDTKASFRYQWGDGTHMYAVTFALELQDGRCWLLRIVRDDGVSTLGFSMGIDEALKDDHRFSKIQWFSEEEWRKHPGNGCSLPY
jgi:hypothetical protein